MAFVAALIIAILCVIASLAGLVNAGSPGAALGGGITASVIFFIANWIYIYCGTPVIGFSSASYWFSSWWIFVEVLIVVIVATACGGYDGDVSWTGVIVAIVCVVMVCIPIFSGTWTEARAKQLSREAKVTMESPGTYPDTDPAHLILLSEDMATYKAQQGMGQGTTANASGVTGNLSTYIQLGEPVLQSIGGHAYYIFALEPSGYRNQGRLQNVIPGYMKVDAENPDTPAKLVTQDNSGHNIAMKYYPNGWFSRNLYRYIWSKNHDEVIQDPTLEIDESGKPYFTVSVNRLTLNNETTIPDKLLIVDPQTGDIKKYDLNEVPDWVDRVYSHGTIESMLDWWGQWHAAKYHLCCNPTANRYHVPDGEDPVLVYTTGGHPAYQAIMTSWNNDKSASFLVLSDARDNHAEAYQIPGLTLESVATKAIEGSSQNVRKLIPAHMTLHRIYGQLTWTSPLEAENGHAYQGMALIRADDPNGDSVVIATTKADALSKYRVLLAQGTGSNAGPEQNSDIKTTSGTVNAVSQISEGSNGATTTSFVFTLAGDDKHWYHAVVGDDKPELPFIKKGSKVNLTYFETDPTLARRDVGSYDDLSMQLVGVSK